MGKQIRHLDFGHPRCFVQHHGEAHVFQVYRRMATEGLRLDDGRSANLRARANATVCSFCGGVLTLAYKKRYEMDIAVLESIHECRDCGNWKATTSTSMTSPEWILPFIGEFNVHAHIAALDALADEVSRHPAQLFKTTPRQFELLVGSVLGAFMPCEVFHVGKSNDGGIDLVAVSAETPTLIQVKRRLDSEAVEGVDTVKLLFASMAAAGARKGAVVTTAQRFSKNARDWIHLPALRDFGFDIDLISFDRLIGMIRGALPKESGWEQAMRIFRNQHAGRGYWDDLIRHHGNDSYFSVGNETSMQPWSEYRKSQWDHVAECHLGWLFRDSSAAEPRCYLISASDHTRCWSVSSDEFSKAQRGVATAPAQTNESAPPISEPNIYHLDTKVLFSSRSTDSTEPSKANDGARSKYAPAIGRELPQPEFYRVVQRLPPAVLEVIVRTWAMSSGENWETWRW